MPKVAKKTAKKTNVVEAVEEKAPRVRLADLPQAEREKRARELISELYNMEGEGDEVQAAKRGIRAKLRTIDKDWVVTHSTFIDKNWPPAKAEKAAKPAKPAKANKTTPVK